MKKTIVMLAAIFILMFSGCAHVTEVDGKAFVTAIGFDKGENYNLRFTFVFTSPSKSGSDAQGREKDEVIVIEAPSLYSAIEQINNFESKHIELTHTQTIVFSEELAREGLEEYIYMLVRSSHFRPNTYICIADKSSMEFLEKINPIQTYHLEKYFQLIFSKMSSGRNGDLHLYDSYFGLLSSGGVSVLPYCSINELTLKDNAHEETPTGSNIEKSGEEPTEQETLGGHFAENTDDFAINTLAGTSVSQSENTAEIQGVGVLKNGVLVGVLGRLEAAILQMLTNSYPSSYVTLSNPEYPDKMITCYVSQKNQAEIKVSCNQDNPKISIEIDFEGDFSEVGKHGEYVKEPVLFEEYFELKTKEEVEKFLYKITNEMNCDVCRFSEAAKGCFFSADEWENYNWSEKFSECEYVVTVNLTVRTYGELSQRG